MNRGSIAAPVAWCNGSAVQSARHECKEANASMVVGLVPDSSQARV